MNESVTPDGAELAAALAVAAVLLSETCAPPPTERAPQQLQVTGLVNASYRTGWEPSTSGWEQR